jgi:predicted TIM-barrel fold metal-dependent hydrolase
MDDNQGNPKELLLREFVPRTCLVHKETQVLSPRFPVVDAHNHLGETFGGGWCNRPVQELLDVLDASGVTALVDLDGGWGESILQQRLDKYKSAAPERFAFFGGVDLSAWAEQGKRFPDWAAARLRAQVSWGAQGLKIWKPFGLHVRDHHEVRVAVDDPRLDTLWATAGELELPVLIHVADPVAFFEPLDAHNERWEELQAHPDWHFPSPAYTPFLQIVGELANLVARHPKTTFIGAHVGCYAENLDWVGALLDRCPNFFVDISARLGELGRQPYSSRRFCLKYSDRILFGADVPAGVEEYRLYYRFLETDDEYFNYNPGEVPAQGRWFIHGLSLPDDVLEKIYSINAARVLRLN